MGWLVRIFHWIWRRVSDATTLADLLDLFDLKTAVVAAVGGVVALFVAATNSDWSVQAVLLDALIGAACFAVISTAIRFWLIDKRRDTTTEQLPSITAELNYAPMTIDDYEVVSSIKVKNRTGQNLKEQCLVTLLEMSCPWPPTMPQDFVLRTESQILGRRSGRFNLSGGHKKTIPVLFRNKIRRDFLILMDENIDTLNVVDREKHKHKIPMPRTVLELVIETTGAVVPGRYLLTLTRGPDWTLHPELRQVSNDYVLGEKPIDLADLRLQLAKLRADGVAMRNDAQSMIDSSAWASVADDWMRQTIATIKEIDEADAEWFRILDAVPPARVALNPNATAAHSKAFREHDYRLVRLDKLIEKYSSS